MPHVDVDRVKLELVPETQFQDSSQIAQGSMVA